MGFYLYDHIKHPDDRPDSIPLTMEWIENEVGFTAPTIRKHYRELFNAGYRSEILDYSNKSIHLPKPKAAKQPTVAEDPLTPALFFVDKKKLKRRSVSGMVNFFLTIPCAV